MTHILQSVLTTIPQLRSYIDSYVHVHIYVHVYNNTYMTTCSHMYVHCKTHTSYSHVGGVGLMRSWNPIK